MLTLISFLLVLTLLVFVHELGHFYMARKAGVKVDEFGIGLPPRAVGYYKDTAGKWQRFRGKKTEEAPSTVYSLNWIPLGGFVKMKGEDAVTDEQAVKDPDSFIVKSVGRRFGIIAAGVTMNVLLAIILLGVGYMFGLPQIVDHANPPAHAQLNNQRVVVSGVLDNSPASAAGLRQGDIIIAINDSAFTSASDIQPYIADFSGQDITLKIQRGAEQEIVMVSPEYLEETKSVAVGVELVESAIVRYPWYLALWYGVRDTFGMIWAVLFGFYMLLKGLIVGSPIQGEVYGPVGIATLVGDAARLGFAYLINFTATLSVIIAVINFLPFPALDGGRALFLLIEKIRGKAVNQKVEAIIHNTGFLLLMLLVVVITVRDILRLI